MLSGVELGNRKASASKIEILASSRKAGKLEVWLDDLTEGKLIATIPVSATGESNWKTFSKTLKNVSGQHDVFVKFAPGSAGEVFVKSLRFSK